MINIPDDLRQQVEEYKKRGVPNQTIRAYVTDELQRRSLIDEKEAKKAPVVSNQNGDVKSEKNNDGIVTKAARLFTPLGETLGDAVATMSSDYKNAQLSRSSLDNSNVLLSKKINELNKTGNVEGANRLRKRLELNAGSTQDSELIPSLNKSTRQIVGEAGVTTLSTLSGGRLSGSQNLNLAGRLGVGTAEGGLFGLTGGLAKDQKGKELAKSTAIGAGIGFSLTGAGEALGSLFRASSRRPAITAERAINTPKKQLKQDLRNTLLYDGEHIGDKIVKGGYKGSTTDVFKQAQSKLDDAGNSLNNLLKKSGNKVVSKQKVYSKLKGILDDPLNEPNARSIRKYIDKYVRDGMNVNQLHQQRVKLGKEIWGGRVGDVSLTTESKILKKELWKAITATLEETVDSRAFKVANDQYAAAFKIGDFALDLEASMRYGNKNIDLWQAVERVYRKTLGGTRSKLFFARNLNRTNKLFDQSSKLSPLFKRSIEREVTK